MESLRAAASTRKARVRGKPNQPLVLEKVSRNKVEVAWPLAVSADTCVRLLKLALGTDWRHFVTDPAGVPGAQAATADPAGVPGAQAATAQEGAVAAESAGEVPVSRKVCSSAAGPVGLRPPSAGTSPSATLASTAATVEARSAVNLLALKLEAITQFYGDGERSQFEEPQQAYTVNWEAELGQGTYGKVYVAAKGPATGDHRYECQEHFAIKMLRDKGARPKGCHAEAVAAAEDEVRRHVALGSHKNVVGLVDVGLFRRSPRLPGCNSSSVHIGLVFDMYEIDVRQFLKKSSFTQSGMRHVLNSVLEGLRFIHDRGCVHCDLKPANIFMRGAIPVRGCFAKERLQQYQVPAVVPSLESRTQFQYQVPDSFEVRGDGKS